ncbi:MAG: hypothetical protein H5U03_04915 [Clostridia bacterium]|nr:hypothetical protein [Clostridia bacterium]
MSGFKGTGMGLLSGDAVRRAAPFREPGRRPAVEPAARDWSRQQAHVVRVSWARSVTAL